jgi:pyruvate/2-oxoglutarate dehydrogenase complex dihydrolipoamide acyltransferase (E2) component
MHEIRIPKSGMSTIEVDITDLFIAVGQTVKVGDSIAEIDTEKVTMTLEADADGTVTEIRVAIGDSREVGDVICVLSTG